MPLTIDIKHKQIRNTHKATHEKRKKRKIKDFEFKHCRKSQNLELNWIEDHSDTESKNSQKQFEAFTKYEKISNQRVSYTNEISTESQHSYHDEDIEVAEEVSEVNFSYAAVSK